jgi:hypothetical protein
MRFWRQVVLWLQRWLRPLRALGPAPALVRRWGSHAAALPDDLQEQLARLPGARGAVRDAVAMGIEDHAHLRDVLLGDAAADPDFDDVALLAEAELTLRALIGRAGAVAALSAVAARRQSDRAGRQAAGEAMLELRDQARALHEAASAALRWAAAPGPATADQLRACAERLRQVSAPGSGRRER